MLIIIKVAVARKKFFLSAKMFLWKLTTPAKSILPLVNCQKDEVPEIEDVPAEKVTLLSQQMTQLSKVNQSSSFSRNDNLVGER